MHKLKKKIRVIFSRLTIYFSLVEGKVGGLFKEVAMYINIQEIWEK